MNNHKQFYINNEAILKNADGKLLILEKDSKWQLPGGRMEESETPEEALKREINEETSISDFVIEEPLEVRLSNSGNTYMVTFLCYTPDNPEVKLSVGHQDYAWIGKDKIDNYKFWHPSI